MRLLRRYGLLLLAVMLIVMTIRAPYTDATNSSLVEEKRQEQAEIDRRLQQEKQELKQQKGEEETLKAELNRLDSRLRELRSELNRLAGEISRTEGEIVVAEEELAQAEEQLEYRDNLLKRRLRVIYERGQITYLEVLLESSNFSDFLTRLVNLKAIADNDLLLLEEVTAERDQIQARKEELEEKKSGLEALRRQTLGHEQEVKVTLASRGQVLTELKQEINRRLKAIEEMEREAAALEQLILRLLEPGTGNFAGISGRVCWPTDRYAYISSYFGARRDPFTGYSSYHGGLDIAIYTANWPLSSYYCGTPSYILAAEGGTVIFSGIYISSSNNYQKAPGRDEFQFPQYKSPGAYGVLVIIDHGTDSSGNRWQTVYGHCHSRLVAQGQTVSRGQRIGVVGSTGNSTGPHLHFEVRKNGERIDPLPYIK